MGDKNDKRCSEKDELVEDVDDDFIDGHEVYVEAMIWGLKVL